MVVSSETRIKGVTIQLLLHKMSFCCVEAEKTLNRSIFKKCCIAQCLKKKETTMLTRRATLAAAPLVALGLTLSAPPIYRANHL